MVNEQKEMKIIYEKNENIHNNKYYMKEPGRNSAAKKYNN